MPTLTSNYRGALRSSNQSHVEGGLAECKNPRYHPSHLIDVQGVVLGQYQKQLHRSLLDKSNIFSKFSLSCFDELRLLPIGQQVANLPAEQLSRNHFNEPTSAGMSPDAATTSRRATAGGKSSLQARNSRSSSTSCIAATEKSPALPSTRRQSLRQAKILASCSTNTIQYNDPSMDQDTDKRDVRLEITEHIFGNAPTMLALCLTTVGLIKIYAALQRITTLADNFLVFCLAAFLFATIFSYLALRSTTAKRRARLARVADVLFISGLSAATVVAFFVVYALAG
jgi:hypothetical protein